MKPLVFAAGLAPALWLAWRICTGNLTANPIEYITHFTGRLDDPASLSPPWPITPPRKLLRLPDLIRFRRMLGLFAFFYGCLHFITWIGLDKFFDCTRC